MPHDVPGEDIAATVSLRPGTEATGAELAARRKAHLADNKVPRAIPILDALPFNPDGKVPKEELAPVLAEATEERWRRRSARAAVTRPNPPSRSRCGAGKQHL